MKYEVSNGEVGVGDYVLWGGTKIGKNPWGKSGNGFLDKSRVRLGRVSRLMCDSFSSSVIVKPVSKPGDYKYPVRISNKENIVKVNYDQTSGVVSFTVWEEIE